MTGIRRCGPTEDDVLLLEEAWHGGVGFGESNTSARSRASLFLLLVESDVELSATFLEPCLAMCCHNSHPDDTGLNL